MVSSTDGWIVGADGVYRWQEVRGFPADYLVFIIVIIALVAVSLLVYFKKRKHLRE
jgi:LPXTG-motif cell wall-anchored protein